MLFARTFSEQCLHCKSVGQNLQRGIVSPDDGRVSVGEEIAIREGSLKLAILEPAKEFASHQNAPTWLDIDRDHYKGKVLSLPKREDIHLPVNEQLIVELYSK